MSTSVRFTELVTKKGNKIVLYRGTSKEGRDFHAYLLCTEKQYFKIRGDVQAGKPCARADEYGEVLYMGIGLEPDEEAEEFLEEYLATM